MAINYTGTSTETTELPEILAKLYAESNTFMSNLVEIDQGHKSGTDVYESSVSVSSRAASNDAVTATGDIDMKFNKTTVNLVSIEFSDVIDEAALKGTRFERSIKDGQFNYTSDEFDQRVLIQVAPAIGEAIENKLWNGADAATKAAFALLTPGAAQGSASVGAQTLVSNMVTQEFNSIPMTILYNHSNGKATPGLGLGDYRKVLSIDASIDESNVAAEYQKIYGAAPSKVINHLGERAEIYAPLADRQFIKLANNKIGSLDNKNFIIEGSGDSETISYMGHKINFVPLVGFRILAIPSYIKILTDLASDVSLLEIGKMANGERRRFIKNIQAMATWCVGQDLITVYGG